MRSTVLSIGWAALMLLGCEVQQPPAAPARPERFESPPPATPAAQAPEASNPTPDHPAEPPSDTPAPILPPDVVAREAEDPGQALDRAMSPASPPAGEGPSGVRQ